MIIYESLRDLILLKNMFFAIEVIGMLGVDDGPVTNDHIPSQILRDAVDKLFDVGIGNSLLLDLVGDLVSQMPHLLQPAVQKIPKLLASVLKFSLFLLVVFGTEVFG